MNSLIHLLVAIPFIGLIINFIVPEKNEKLISSMLITTLSSHSIVLIISMFIWYIEGAGQLNIKDLSLVKTVHYEFFFDFTFDVISLVFLLVGNILTFLVAIYSRYYLHREEGFKRFFNTILLFFGGYVMVILSGNFETLFIGWEILGVSSFLLIAFYRHRYLPVRNAYKVFTVYRLADVGLILAMWLSHHFWQENITFMRFNDAGLVHQHLVSHSTEGLIISLLILLAALAKSAQFPFMWWLPRAMEGPTPSSAIFYGSLSVHMGVFLLLRTAHFWESQLLFRELLFGVGFLTAWMSVGIARVQSSVKSQIAYASIVQIGLIFIEISLGWYTLAMVHFAGNAFLRTYQLLVSPSVVSYLIREQFYNYQPKDHPLEDSLPKKIEYTLYFLSLKEWNLDNLIKRIVWIPIKSIGRFFIKKIKTSYFWVVSFITILGFYFLSQGEVVSPNIYNFMPYLFGILALFSVIIGFSERNSAKVSLRWVLLSQFLFSLAISFNELYDSIENIVFLSGPLIFGILSHFILGRLKSWGLSIRLDRYHGYAYQYPILSFFFLLCMLGISGFPISPTFIGEDLIFSHIHENQFLLAIMAAIVFILTGLTLMSMYARIFLGIPAQSGVATPYKKS